MEHEGLKALVVDDSPLIRQMIFRFLETNIMINADEAKNGEECMEKLFAGDFDIVFLDWHMPGISGLEVLKMIRADQRLKDLFVIMVSSETNKTMIIEAVKLGVNGYITKPFTTEVLKEKLKQVMKLLRFGEYLVRKNCISKEQLKEALTTQKTNSKMFGEVAVEMQLLTKEQVDEVVTKQKESDVNAKIGRVASVLGMLTDDEIDKIVGTQEETKSKLGEIIVDLGFLGEEEVKKHLGDFEVLREVK